MQIKISDGCTRNSTRLLLESRREANGDFCLKKGGTVWKGPFCFPELLGGKRGFFVAKRRSYENYGVD